MKKISTEELSKLSMVERYNLLSPRQKEYYDIMNARAGVLFITSKPGQSKSAQGKEIAYIMDHNYVEVRLSTADETDFGMPKLKELVINGVKLDVHTMTVPEWAIEANEKLTIIHFEELNRCSLNVRNACLGVLLERTIGTKFVLNSNVKMMASGNLGEDDGCDTDEFDGALNNRLIHIKHDLLPDEWIEYYAKYNVHPLIVSFIKNQPEYLYRKDGSENGVQPKAFATPRSWTHLSEYILTKLDNREKQMEGKYDINEVKNCVRAVGHGYIGTSIVKFIKYLDESMTLTYKDILTNFNKVKSRLNEVNRDKKSELLSQLITIDFKKLKPNEVKNLISFLEIVDEDERVGFLTRLLDDNVLDVDVEEPYRTILESFSGLLKQILTIL